MTTATLERDIKREEYVTVDILNSEIRAAMREADELSRQYSLRFASAGELCWRYKDKKIAEYLKDIPLFPARVIPCYRWLESDGHAGLATAHATTTAYILHHRDIERKGTLRHPNPQGRYEDESKR